MLNKIAILADLHFGVHNNSDSFLESQLKFFYELFIPYLEKNKIEKILILGDLFDNRNTINIKIINNVLKLFDDLKKYEIFILVGNHDSYLTDCIEINSLKLLKQYSNVHLIEKTQEILDKILVVPWIINVEEFYNEIQLKNYDICVGHFGIVGFKINKYKVSDYGISSDFFSKCKLVISGHFHIRSIQKKNTTEIVYVGCPYQLNRNDIDELKGFCILDLDSLKYEFIDNEISLKYVKINYPEVIHENFVKGNIVDVEIKYDVEFKEEDVTNYLKKLESFGIVGNPNVKLINNFSIEDESQNFDVNKNTSVENLMTEYISCLEIPRKENIKFIIDELYSNTKSDV